MTEFQEYAIREVAPGDLAGLEELFGGLDERSRYYRWFTGGPDIARAAKWSADPAGFGAIGLVATVGDEIVGHAAVAPAGDDRGEVCFEVAATWRHHGIAGHLLEELATRADRNGWTTIVAEVLPENADMLAVLREHGACPARRDGGALELALPVDVARRPVRHA